ncbi:MAG: aromatic amino acid transport family protein [bacterium]|nr:aromatic amino acid transport family protein [bacterium]
MNSKRLAQSGTIKNMKFSLYSKGIGMMVGLILGAGIFAMPAAVARAGVWWGVGHFVIAFILMFVLQIWLAEIAFSTEAPKRFTGFARAWLGKGAERIAFLSVLVGYYGGFLAYGVLGGIFLSTLFPVFSVVEWSFLFFAVAGVLTLVNFRSIGAINFYLTIPLVLFIVILAWMALPEVSLHNFSSGSPALWFLPYGIFIFAFSGIAAVPETADILRRLSMRDVRNVIGISMGIVALFYLLFVYAVTGVTGIGTTDDALTGLASVLGNDVIAIGALIGFLAVITSYLALAADMKNIFNLDYKIPQTASWAYTVLPAPILFFLGISGFLDILSFVGSVVFGISGVLIFLMARNFHKAHPEHSHRFFSTKNPLSLLVLLFLIAGVLLELLQIGGVL